MSVEQQRKLGHAARRWPENIQVNVEEGRHLWAMVYLLHRYFGRDGREGEEFSSDETVIRKREFWVHSQRKLFFFCFTTFTDVTKYQLRALAEAVLIRSHVRAHSCSLRKRILCLSARQASVESSVQLKE